MTRTFCRALLATGLFAFAGSGASGQESLPNDNPRCAQMVNVAACNCALQNGGSIQPNGRGFTEGRGPALRATYVDCMRKRGRAS